MAKGHTFVLEANGLGRWKNIVRNECLCKIINNWEMSLLPTEIIANLCTVGDASISPKL